MKLKFLFLTTFLTFALILPMVGQQNPVDMTKPDIKKHDNSKMMGKPTVETTVDGYYMKVWLMTQLQHQKLRTEMRMNKLKNDPMVTGTFHIMLNLKDVETGKEISDATANVLIVSPSMKNSLVDLKPMMSHFGGPLLLDEKGEYNLKVSVIVGGVTRSTQFKYVIE